MRAALLSTLVAFLAILTFPATAQTLEGSYCAPEFGSCGDVEEGDGGNTGGGGSTLGGNGSYEKVYGADYSACVAYGAGGCLRCSYVLKLKSYFCTSVRYSGGCQCIERYSNYILQSCTTRGACDYGVY